MEFLTTIFYFLIVIGILVFIHEFGHFIAARASKMRAEVFAFGIGPRLFGYNKINGFTFGKMDETLELGNHTDYRICAFPIGGYVKVAGMIDESMDKEFINKPPQPWEYRAKPIWKRMIVITAGVLMNIFLAFIIFYFITLFKGKTTYDTTTVGFVSKNTLAYDYGIKSNDVIKSINNNRINTWDEIISAVHIDNLGEELNILISRNGTDTLISIPKEQTILLTEKAFGLSPDKIQTVIADVLPDKPAIKTGLQSGDVIISFNNEEIKSTLQLNELIRKNANTESKIVWNRNGSIMESPVTPGTDSTIGVMLSEIYTGPEKVINYNVFSAIPKTFRDMYYFGGEVFIKSIAKIIKGDIPFNKAIGGPVKIAKASAQSAEGGILTFLNFVALLSMSLAIINILPFPALDGGHFVMLLLEAIFRKPIPYKIQISIQYAGFIILLAFMLFVIYNDIISL